MSAWVSHSERVYAERGWKQPEHDFDCVVCHEPVIVGYATDIGVTMSCCRECEEKRIRQLVAAEKELARVKKLAAVKLREIALASEMTANDLEKKQ